MKLKTFIYAAMICGIVMTSTSCQEGGVSKKRKQSNVPVAKLTPISIEVPNTYVADIQAIQYVEIKPRVTGYIEQIHVDEGKRVSKGQRLFSVSAVEYTSAVNEAKANLKQAEAELKMAEVETGRVRRLLEKDIVSSVRLDQAKAENEVAEMKVQQAKAQLERAQANLAYTVITSPCDGTIDRIPYKIGSVVDEQTLLTTVTDVSDVFAYFKVNEREYLDIKRLQLNGEQDSHYAELELILADGTTYPYKGKVETIEGDFDRTTGSIAFRARFSNKEGLLKHGVSGKIKRMNQLKDVLLVPQKSTFEIQEFTYVYTVDNEGKVSTRSFKPLTRYGSFYITDDLDPNTNIVYEGVQLVKDGTTIEREVIDLQPIIDEDRKKFNY